MRGPVNAGAALFLLVMCSIPGWLGALARLSEPYGASECGLEFGLACEALIPTDPLAILPCGLFFFPVVLAYVLLRPPTHDDTFREPARWSWSMARVPHVLSMCCLAWLALFVAFAANETVSTGFRWAESEPGVCDTRESQRASERNGLRRNVTYGGMLVVGMFLVAGVSQRWRRTKELYVDEVGVRVDGVRFAFKDLEPARLTERGILLKRFSGEMLLIPVFTPERAWAQEIVDRIQSARPSHTEDRSSERDKLSKL